MATAVFTVAEIAKMLKVSKPTVYNELHRMGGIPSFRVGKKILIPREPFEKWLTNMTESDNQGNEPSIN
jgi:excisionase family DNA binding protein